MILTSITNGIPLGQMQIFTGGRRAGKSYYNQIGMNNLCQEIILPTEPMKKPKYQFSRAKWYEVHLMFKSYDPIQERIDWCAETFGPQPEKPDAWSRWYTSFTTIRFRDSKDYEWFMLRWS